MIRSGLPWEEWEDEFLRCVIRGSEKHGRKYSLREIGEVLQRSGGTVKARLRLFGFTVRRGKFTMVDPERDEELMRRWRGEA